MNKRLKFRSLYADAVAQHQTGVTIRLFDDKSLSEGDLVDFVNFDTGETIAKAVIERVTEGVFGDLARGAADEKGIYEQYEEYHKRPISAETPAKLIHYRLVS